MVAVAVLAVEVEEEAVAVVLVVEAEEEAVAEEGGKQQRLFVRLSARKGDTVPVRRYDV